MTNEDDEDDEDGNDTQALTIFWYGQQSYGPAWVPMSNNGESRNGLG